MCNSQDVAEDAMIVNAIFVMSIVMTIFAMAVIPMFRFVRSLIAIAMILLTINALNEPH